MLTQRDIEEIKKIVEDQITERTRLLPTRDEFFTKMDELLGEIKAARAEFAVHTSSHSHINDDIDLHGVQIKRIEKHLHLSVIAA